MLESRLLPPHEADQGYYAGDLGGLPRLRDSRLLGEYPLVTVEFEDDDLPVQVRLEAFTPFIPLDAASSGIPVAVLRYTVTNPTALPLDVSVVGSLANPVGAHDQDVFHFPQLRGTPAQRVPRHRRHPRRALHHRPARGLAAIRQREPHHRRREHDREAAVAVRLLAGRRAGVLGRPARRRPARSRARRDARDRRPARLDHAAAGRLARHPPHAASPARPRDFEFRLTWHFPNRPQAWLGNINLPNPNAERVVQNFYATQFVDAWDVAEQVEARLPELEASTRAFHAALFGSSLPPEVLDAVSANLAVIRSTTCFRLADGTFAAWEGSFDHSGSCEGTCTHVWGYAQGLAYLFPELERSARRTEFLLETRDDGRQNFRSNRIFDAPQWDFHPAVDGQLGTIVRLYREWRFSGDDAFVREVWPAAVRALEFAFTEWDSQRRRRARQQAAQHLRHRVLRRELAEQLGVLRRARGRSAARRPPRRHRARRALARGRRARVGPHGRAAVQRRVLRTAPRRRRLPCATSTAPAC